MPSASPLAARSLSTQFPKRARVHPQITRDHRDRLLGLPDYPDRSLAELRIELPTTLWHGSPHSPCLHALGGCSGEVLAESVQKALGFDADGAGVAQQRVPVRLADQLAKGRLALAGSADEQHVWRLLRVQSVIEDPLATTDEEGGSLDGCRSRRGRAGRRAGH